MINKELRCGVTMVAGGDGGFGINRYDWRVRVSPLSHTWNESYVRSFVRFKKFALLSHKHYETLKTKKTQ